MPQKTIDDLYTLIDRCFDKLQNNSLNFNVADLTTDFTQLDDNLSTLNDKFKNELLKELQTNVDQLKKFNKDSKKFQDEIVKNFKTLSEDLEDIKLEGGEGKSQNSNSSNESDKKGRKQRVGENINKIENFQKKLGDTGSFLKRKAASMEGNPAMRKGMFQMGKMASGAAKGLGKAIPVIGQVIMALDILGDVAKEAAENYAKQIELENKLRDSTTKLNIEFANLKTEGIVDKFNTAVANSLMDLNVVGKQTLNTQQIDIMSNQAALETQLSSMLSGYNDAAWGALAQKREIDATAQINAVDVAADQAINKREQDLNTLRYQNNERKREVARQQGIFDYKQDIVSLEREQADYIANKGGLSGSGAALQMALMDLDTNAPTVGNIANGQAEAQAQGISYDKTAAILSGAAGAASNSIVGQIGSADKYYESIVTASRAKEDSSLNKQKNELLAQAAFAENVKSASEAFMEGSNQIENAGTTFKKEIVTAAITAKKDMQNSIDNFAHEIENWTGNWEKLYLNSAASKGITTKDQSAIYGKFMNESLRQVSKWGLKAEDVINMQNRYGEGTGRSILANTTDLDKTAAVGKYLGDNNLAVDIANSTEIFNMGMSETMDTVWEMTKQVNKMGLDGRKYMKDMTKNLKMAQKYNFKGGVQGVMNMAKWAQSVRFDMNQLPGIIDKILDGGLEGAITQGAQLQVLGGNFAMGADPLAMMYESMDDPEALMKRYSGMLKGMGTWNSDTGQVEFKGVNGMMLRQMAKVSGIDVETLRNMASFDMKKEKMSGKFNSKLSEENKDSLINKAYYDSKSGQWMVNDMYGNAKEVNKITDDDMKTLQAETHEGKVEQALTEIVGHLDLAAGLSEEEKATFAQAIIDSGLYHQQQEIRYQEQKKYFQEDFQTNLGNIKNSIVGATNAFKTQLHTDTFDPMKNIAKYTETINTNVDKILTELGIIKSEADVTTAQSSTNSKEANDMAAAIVTAFGKTGKENELQKLKAIAANGYDSTIFNEKYDDITGKGFWEAEDDWFSALTEDQKNAIRNNPRLFYDTLAEMNKNGNNGVGNRHLSALKKANDAFSSANGQSMTVAASKVTPINDGEVATTNPHDHALFAKVGGPFDTLFNGIFGKINKIASVVANPSSFAMNPIGEGLKMLKDVVFNDPVKKYNSSSDTIKVELSGKIELTDSQGRHFDIFEEFRRNPNSVRSITQIIAESINKNINGGKSSYQGGLATARFKGVNF